MISGPGKWYTVAETLRQAVHTELTTTPQRSGVVPGQIAWDECDCGLLAVSVAQIYLTETFPDPLSRRFGNACARFGQQMRLNHKVTTTVVAAPARGRTPPCRSAILIGEA